MKTVIFDIDGTLADIEHRRIHLEGKRRDWKRFNAAMDADTPLTALVELYQTLWESGVYDLQIVTGRNEASREVTEAWLNQHGIAFNRILMRADGDYRADYIVKEEFLDIFKSEDREIAFAIDDRQQVVDMWRRNGIVCLQCDVGDF